MIYQKGFTLIEIIIVIAILTVIISFGMIVDFSSFSSSTFQNEESKIIALLQKARSRSMSNMFNATHGVCYDNVGFKYKIFKGNIGDSSPDKIEANGNIAISSSPAIFLCNSSGIVFSQLTGNTTGVTVHITDGIKGADIIINNEGTINW